MTNPELNKAIAGALGIYRRESMFGRVIVWISGNSPQEVEVDYCNNWSDLMPLVVEYDLSRTFMVEDSTHDVFAPPCQGLTSDGNLIETNNKDPKRALAECLLKVLTN